MPKMALPLATHQAPEEVLTPPPSAQMYVLSPPPTARISTSVEGLASLATLEQVFWARVNRNNETRDS